MRDTWEGKQVAVPLKGTENLKLLSKREAGLHLFLNMIPHRYKIFVCYFKKRQTISEEALGHRAENSRSKSLFIEGILIEHRKSGFHIWMHTGFIRELSGRLVPCSQMQRF